MFKFSNTTTSNISNILNGENPFKLNEIKEDEQPIKEFTYDENKTSEIEQEEEQETVFKKNYQNLLDISLNFSVIKKFYLLYLLQYIITINSL